MNFSEVKIVADSSIDIKALSGADFATVPLKIITDDKQYVDNADLDVGSMVSDLCSYKGKSSTACPAPSDWLEAFEGARYVFCITITSGLSGSYNSACVARDMYTSEDADRKVFVIDSLSTGPELCLIADKLSQLIAECDDFEEVCEKISEYQKSTGLLFMLRSMRNLANNGRVSPLVAKAAGLLGIRIVGKASDIGTLEVMQKCRGDKKTFSQLVSNLEKLGFNGSRIYINHCLDEVGAKTLAEQIKSVYPDCQMQILPTGGLCSFYAESGGILIGFEKR